MARGTDITQFKQTYRERNEGDFLPQMVVVLRKEWDLKYGENPHQHGAVYVMAGSLSVSQLRDEPVLRALETESTNSFAGVINLQSVREDGKGKGGLSLTNTMDITRAADCLKYFPEPAAIIMKHTIASGFAKQTNGEQTFTDLFRLARDADLRSNFGGTLVVNRPLNQETAEAMYELKGKNPFFVDVLAAPGYEEGVIGYLQSRAKELRMAEFSHLENLPKFRGDDTLGLRSLKEMPGGLIGVQDIYLTRIRSSSDFVLDPMVVDEQGVQHTVARDPTKQELDDLLTAWYVNIAGARSNGVVFVRKGVSVALGAGQVERVGAVEQAMVKGMQKAMDREGLPYDPLLGIAGYERLHDNPFQGAVCSSDGFFPFGDSIKLLARVGVTAVVQPYGSKRDAEVIDAANKHNVAMPATLERCFGHF